MKKLVLLTLAATVVAGSAFAAAPVTKISDGSTKDTSKWQESWTMHTWLRTMSVLKPQ